MTEEKKIVPEPKQRTITVDGIQVHVDGTLNDDLEVLDWMNELNDGNVFHLPKLLRRLVGDDYTRVLDHLRDSQGIVRQKTAIEFVLDLFKAASPNS